MKLLSTLRETLGFTENEIRVVLFLCATLAVGTVIRLARQEAPPAPPSFDYAASDSVFTARSAATSRAPDGTPPPPPERPAAGSIDINTAMSADLDRLPGIGPAIAERIIADREENGPFDSVEDLARVKGIGPKKLEKIRPFVSAGPTR
jgi:competence protein ComEA